MNSNSISLLRKIIIGIALALYPLSNMLDVLLANVDIYDTPNQLVHAMLMQKGAIPYRDFFSFFVPLGYLFNAWALSLWGMSVLSDRMLRCIFYGIFLVIVFFYLKGNRSYSDTPKVSIMFLLFTFGGISYTYALALSVLACLFYLWSQRENALKNDIYLLLSGLFSGLAFLTKINFGLYTVTAIALSLILYKRKTWPKDGFLYFLPIGMIIAFSLIYSLVVVKDLRTVIDWAFVYPLTKLLPRTISVNEIFLAGVLFPIGWCLFKYFRTILKRSPSFLWGSFAFMLATFGFLCYSNGHRELLKNMFVITFFVALFLLLFHLFIVKLKKEEMLFLLTFSFFSHYFLKSPDIGHFFTTLPFASLAFIHEPFNNSSRWRRAIAAGALFILILIFGIAEAELPRQISKVTRLLFSPASLLKMGDAKFFASPNLPREGPEFEIYDNKEEIEGVRFLIKHTREDELVYVGVEENARMTFNNMRMYWLLNRLPPTRYVCFESGLSNEEWIQKETIEDLKKNHVDWIVLWRNMKNPNVLLDENDPANSRLLDRYLHDQYSPVRSFETFTIYRKNGSQALHTTRSGVR